jgi:DNA helicase TIP49 (TBP-interacting protein)
VRRLVRGELLAASFRKRIKVKMDEENAVMQKELEEQRVKAALKKQLSKKMKIATAINEDD